MRAARVFLVLALLHAASASAADRYMDLKCWAPMTVTIAGTSYSVPGINRSSGVTWAAVALDQTDASGGTSTQSFGHEFDDGQQSEVQCSLVLPGTYSTTGNVPQVTLEGWAIDNGTCAGGDPPPIKFTFEASSRSYAAGDVANASWSAADSDDISYTCPVFIQSKDVVRAVTLDATPAASDWAANELVFIKLSRVSNDSFDQPFHLSRVRLRIPE